MNLAEILALATIVKNETGIDKNTALRIGTALEEIIKYFRDNTSAGTGGNFVVGEITTEAGIDEAVTPGAYSVALAENYLDWLSPAFSLLVLPYTDSSLSLVQVAYNFTIDEQNEFSIKARWLSFLNEEFVFSAWKTVAGSSSSTFTSNFVANPAFGKYTAGSTVPANGKTVNEVLLDAFSNYLSPAFTSFSSELDTIVEVGTTLTSPQNFTFKVSNSGNIKPNTLKVTDTTAGTDLVTDAAISSPVSVPIGAVEKSLNGATNSWRASAQNTQDAWFNSPTFSVTWRLRTFHGAVDVEPLLSAEVRALTGAWDTVNSFAITLSKTRYCIALRSGKNLVSVITQNNENLRGNFVKRATQMNITLPDGTTAKYDIYDFASATIMNITATVTLS